MIVVRTWAVALTGLRGELIEVEADITQHKPDFRLIGMPDKALGEAVRRVTNACENSGLALPDRRLTVNLSPASLPKQGSGFDLAVALAAVATDGRLDPESLVRTVHIGELGLDGRVLATVSTVSGQVKLANGDVWTARTDGAADLEPGSAVRVDRIDGATAYVRPRPEEIPS